MAQKKRFVKGALISDLITFFSEIEKKKCVFYNGLIKDSQTLRYVPVSRIQRDISVGSFACALPTK